MNTHRTPGPWIANVEEGKVFRANSDLILSIADIFDSDGLSIGYGGEDDEIEANTLLIAAAPDLLDALKEIITSATPLPCRLLEQAQAAIAKAEGRDVQGCVMGSAAICPTCGKHKGPVASPALPENEVWWCVCGDHPTASTNQIGDDQRMVGTIEPCPILFN